MKKNAGTLCERWQEILEDQTGKLSASKVLTKEAVVAQMLENQQEWINKNPKMIQLDETAFSNNSMGSNQVATWAPVLISMVRRTAPNLLAMDFFGVQPLSTPSGQIFAMRVRSGSQTGPELWAKTASDPKLSGETDGKAMATAEAERLGSTRAWGKIGISIEQSQVTAGSRGLYTDYTHEVRQDMMAVHGQDVDAILSDALVIEVQSEMNREFINTMKLAAKAGGAGLNSTSALVGTGTFDVQADGDGRILQERAKAMLWTLELNANAIMRDTRMGKGNKVLASQNVASFLAMAGLLDWTISSNVAIQSNLVIQPNESYAGKLANGMDLYIDQYATEDYVLVAYKGTSNLDAGIFYAPYTPLEMYRGQGEDNMNPRIAFKTRYGIVSNPFFSRDELGVEAAGKGLGAGENGYFRYFTVTNLG
jgi:hypothetical protein